MYRQISYARAEMAIHSIQTTRHVPVRHLQMEKPLYFKRMNVVNVVRCVVVWCGVSYVV